MFYRLFRVYLNNLGAQCATLVYNTTMVIYYNGNMVYSTTMVYYTNTGQVSHSCESSCPKAPPHF